MNKLQKTIALLTIYGVPGLLHAQFDIPVAGRQVQIHGSLSEGFAYSNDNNYLLMDTTHGSFFTEAGLSASSQITDKFRVGVQVYDRYIGELSKGKVYLDWALADYRWKDWIGFRGGKIKTSLGLYNNTQDQEFLQTWALLPQSLYPVDLRSISIAHVGGDIYGNIPIKRGGSLSYDAYGGSIPDDPRGGYRYELQAQGAKLSTGVAGRTAGFDLRWSPPISGLMVGTSLAYNHREFSGTLGAIRLPLTYETTLDRVMAFYGEYTRGNFRADAEYRAQTRRAGVTAEIPSHPVLLRPGSDEPAWFISGAYRLSKRVEIGSYYSHYHLTQINPLVAVAGTDRDHIFDKVVTLRLDLARFWDLKIEGHFMDGVSSPGQAHGFYPQDNPQGLKPLTNMLVIRTGWYF
jgi:hypothetical protein